PSLLLVRESSIDSADRGLQRFKALSAVTTFVNVITIFLISCLMPGQIVEELRSDPNWFLGPSATNTSTIGTTNASLSRHLADAVAVTTKQIGLYQPLANKKKQPRRRRSDNTTTSTSSPDAGTAGEAATQSDKTRRSPETDSPGKSRDSDQDSRQPRSAIELMEDSSDDDEDKRPRQADSKETDQDSRKARSALELMEQQSDEESPDAGGETQTE
ncbi:MAG: hypothetical protein ABEN55_14330, partial [Bradymonadaceae bacterium]